MAKYREIPCKFYVACGICKKGREASHKKYCQHCNRYTPRVKMRCLNKKKLLKGKMK